MKQDFYGKNMKVLRQHHRELAKLVDSFNEADGGFLIEDAKNGSKTLSIMTDSGKILAHSSYNPEKEAQQHVSNAKLPNPKLIIVLGLGLGYHLKPLLEATKNDNSFTIVIEKDVSLFKAALHANNLTEFLISEKFRWLIGVPLNNGLAVANNLIFKEQSRLQLLLKTMVVFEHPVLTKQYFDYYKGILKSFREAAHLVINSYGNCPHDSMIGVQNIMSNIGTIIKNPGIKDLFGVFKGIPGIIVSTGPSLDKNINDLFSAMDKAVVIAADASLKVMLNKRLHPHMVSSLERVIETSALFEGLDPEDMQKTWLAAAPVVMPQTYEHWKGPALIAYRDFAHFDWLGIPKGTVRCGPSCSNMAFTTLQELGCDPIILVGQDCGFEEPDKTHAENADDAVKFDPRPTFRVKGNYSEYVLTDAVYDLFRKQFVTDIASFKGRCINATEGGAFIEGTELMTLRDAITKFCNKEIDVMETIRQHVRSPRPDEVQRNLEKLRQTIRLTRSEVEGVIETCDKGFKLIDDFDKHLYNEGYLKLEDFLERYPIEEFEKVYHEAMKIRARIITHGKYFSLYLMHIVQSMLIKLEMDLNELPSICDNRKRCMLQSVKMLKDWFPTVGSLCKISLQLLNDASEKLEKEFSRNTET